MLYNPSLSEEPRRKLAAVMPLRQNTSIINWLKETGRMLPRDTEDDKYLDKEDVEITELLAVEYTLEEEELNDEPEIY